MLKRKAEVFSPTDGVVYVCAGGCLDGRGSDFSDPAFYVPTLRLDFRRMRVSARDVELAEATGVELTAKVEVRAAPGLSPESDAIMDGKVYEITRVEGRGRTCWLWMSEVATDGTVTLLDSVTLRDPHGIPTRDGPKQDVWCRRVAMTTRELVADGRELRPSMTVRLMASDYRGEETLKRRGVAYSVTCTQTHGRWLDLTCERKVSDR